MAATVQLPVACFPDPRSYPCAVDSDAPFSSLPLCSPRLDVLLVAAYYAVFSIPKRTDLLEEKYFGSKSRAFNLMTA